MGGALQELPLHLATEIATSVGDLTSLVQLQHTCSTANDLLLQPVTWSDKHAGVIVSSAIRKGWLQGTSRLAQALSASRIVALEWPTVHRTMVLAETVMTLWRSIGNMLAPIYFNLSVEDVPDRCVITVGAAAGNCDRCWCELNNLQSDTLLTTMSHSRRHEAAVVQWCHMPWNPMESARLLQVQWHQDSLQVFMSGHRVGSLELQPNQIPDAAQVTIYVFHARDSMLPRNSVRSRLLATEMGTAYAFSHGGDLQGGAATAASSSLDHIGDADATPLFLTGIFRPALWLSCFPDIMSIGTCNTILRRTIQDNDFWHNANLELSDRVGATFRQSSFFRKLVAAWASSVRSVTCPHQILHSVSSLDDKAWLQGTGEYLPCIVGPVRTTSSTIIRYWRCERQTCQSVRLMCTIPTGASFLVVALRRAASHSSPENSTCLIFRKPHLLTGEMWLRLADGKRVSLPSPNCSSDGSVWRHTFEFRWQAELLEVYFDDQGVSSIPLTSNQTLEPWVRTGAMCIASHSSPIEDFEVDALPWQYRASFGHPFCSYCQKNSLACCRTCQHWFCEEHGVMGSDMCLSCVPDTFLEDCLAGAPTVAATTQTMQVERRRLDALRRLYLRFVGDVPSFLRLCERVEASQNIVCDREVSVSDATDVMRMDESMLASLHAAASESQEVGIFFAVETTVREIPGNVSLSDFGLHTCLPPCLRAGTWPRSVAVATPSSFNVEFLSGVSVVDVLSVVNPHTRDSNLQFREADHSYTWRGHRVSLSVTGLIHSLVQTFNPAEALRAMRGGRNWPRVEYVAPNMVQTLRAGLAAEGLADMELYQLLGCSQVDVEAVCRRLRDLIWTHPGYRHLATIASMTDSQILARWENNRRVAAAEGTWMHAKCECLLNGGSVPANSPEVCMFLKFLQDFQAEGWVIYRTEWAIYAQAEDLAGSIDAVAKRGSDFCILDWKRTRQLASKENGFGRHLRFPLDEIPDSALWHYRIQLNVYAWILHQYYDVTARDLRVVCLHPDNEFTPLVIQVPLLSDCMDRFMSWRRQDMQSCMQLTDAAKDDLRAGQEGPHPSFSQSLRDELAHAVTASAERDRVAPPTDVRGGSQAEEPSFSQMIDEDIQQLEDSLVEHTVPIESSQKRQRIAEAGDAAALELAVSRFMQTEFDPALLQPHSNVTTEEGILHQISALRLTLQAFQPSQNWPANFRYIVEGALAVHRLHLLDISRREEVLFLELIEGSGRCIRAHDGQCFFYTDRGHWSAYEGVVPEATLARCKKFLMHLEGFFVLLGSNVLRDADAILSAAQALLERHSSMPDFLLGECEKAAICRLPTKSKGGGEEDQAGDGGKGEMPWTVAMANTIGKLYVKLQLGGCRSCSHVVMW